MKMEYEIIMLANSESFQIRPTTTVTFQTFYYFILFNKYLDTTEQ